MKCKIMQFMTTMMMMMIMMMMGVEEDRRKRHEAGEWRKWKRRTKGGGEREGEENIADFSSAIVGPDSISSRETRIHRCAECSEHVCGKRIRWSIGSVLALGL
jgi:hypothetical protein